VAKTPGEADAAEPAKSEEIMTERAEREEQSGGSGEQKAGTGGGTTEDEGSQAEDSEAEVEKTWFEFQVLDATGKPLKDQVLDITIKVGEEEPTKQAGKKTDSNGCVKIEDVPKSAKVTAVMAEREDHEWEDVGVGERMGTEGSQGSGGTSSSSSSASASPTV
jgi:hypothetical protein